MMDGNILHSGSGDAIARDWELPELPSGTQCCKTQFSKAYSNKSAAIGQL